MGLNVNITFSAKRMWGGGINKYKVPWSYKLQIFNKKKRKREIKKRNQVLFWVSHSPNRVCYAVAPLMHLSIIQMEGWTALCYRGNTGRNKTISPFWYNKGIKSESFKNCSLPIWYEKSQKCKSLWIRGRKNFSISNFLPISKVDLHFLPTHVSHLTVRLQCFLLPTQMCTLFSSTCVCVCVYANLSRFCTYLQNLKILY